MARAATLCLIAFSLTAVSGLGGCPAEDSEEGEGNGQENDANGQDTTLDGSSDGSLDAPLQDVGAPDGPIEEGGANIDFSGDYLMAVATVIDPSSPFLFSVSVAVSGSGDTVDLTLQALTADLDAEDNPREDARSPIGEVFSYDNVAYSDGAFALETGDIVIPGDANPISFRDITINLIVSGSVTNSAAFCGVISGNMSNPFEVSLDGSTFGAQETDDVTIEVIPSCEGGT